MKSAWLSVKCEATIVGAFKWWTNIATTLSRVSHQQTHTCTPPIWHTKFTRSLLKHGMKNWNVAWAWNTTGARQVPKSAKWNAHWTPHVKCTNGTGILGKSKPVSVNAGEESPMTAPTATPSKNSKSERVTANKNVHLQVLRLSPQVFQLSPALLRMCPQVSPRSPVLRLSPQVSLRSPVLPHHLHLPTRSLANKSWVIALILSALTRTHTSRMPQRSLGMPMAAWHGAKPR